MKVVSKILLASLILSLGSLLSAAPSDDFVLKETDPVRLENIQWHEREDGWLFTCRLKVRSEHLLKPVSYLEFTGLKGDPEEPEVIWSQQKRIFRRNLDSKLGGSVGLFVRVLVKDFPDDAESMALHFANEPPSS